MTPLLALGLAALLAAACTHKLLPPLAARIRRLLAFAAAPWAIVVVALSCRVDPAPLPDPTAPPPSPSVEAPGGYPLTKPPSAQMASVWLRADNTDTIEATADDTGALRVTVTSSASDGGTVVSGTVTANQGAPNDGGANAWPVTDVATHNLLNTISVDQLPPGLGPQTDGNSLSIVPGTSAVFPVAFAADGGALTVQGEGVIGTPAGGVLTVQGGGIGGGPLQVFAPGGIGLAQQQQLPASLDGSGQFRISGSGTTSAPTPSAAVLGGCGQGGNLAGFACDGSGNLNVNIAASTTLTTIATNTGLVVPAANVATVTPNDGGNLPHVCRFVYIGTAGNLAVDLVTSGTDVVFNSAQQGYHALQVQKVWSTGTTATGILCLY